MNGQRRIVRLWVGPKEAAAILGINIKSVYKAVECKQLPSKIVGKSIRIPLSALVPDFQLPAGIPSMDVTSSSEK